MCCARPTKKKQTKRAQRRGRQRRRIPASDAPKNPERKHQRIRRLKREPGKGQQKGHLESRRNKPNGRVRGDCTKEKRRKANVAWVDVNQKQTSPYPVCACVCLVTPELYLFERGGGARGGEREEKKRRSFNKQLERWWGAPKQT